MQRKLVINMHSENARILRNVPIANVASILRGQNPVVRKRDRTINGHQVSIRTSKPLHLAS